MNRPPARLACLGRLLAGLFVLFACLGATTAQAQPERLLERAFLRDEGGQLRLEEVQGQAFIPYEGVLTEGYRPGTVCWLKLTRGGDPSAPPYVLRVRPAWHDDIQVHDPASAAPPQVGGDRHKRAGSDFPGLAHAFRIQQTPETWAIYVRVASVHTYLLDAQLMEQAAAQKLEWITLAIYFAYVTVLVGVLAWALVSLIIRPERVLGSFVVYQVCGLLYALFLFGFAALALEEWVPPRRLDQANNMALILSTGSALAFHCLFLNEYPVRRGLRLIVNAWAMLPLACLGLLALGATTRALQFNALSIVGFSLSLLVGAWLAIPPLSPQQKNLLPRWTLRLFYSALAAIALIGATPLLGWAGATEINLHIFLVHSGLTVVVMGYLLQFRARRVAEQQIATLAAARQKADQEQRARLEQNQFMSMLNHELKTPMSVLKMLVAGQPIQKQAEETIDSIVALLERCLLADRLDNRASPVSRTWFSPEEVLRECILRTRAQARFELSISASGTLHSDRDLYATMVSNLVDNALKYAPPDSPILVSLSDGELAGQPAVCLTTTNPAGRAGLPDPARMFDKYYRAEAARSVPGTGLGLFLVKSFAEMLGGRIEGFIDHATLRVHLCLPR